MILRPRVKHRVIRRRLKTKRFNGEDMARLVRYLTNQNRHQSLQTLRQWFDGPSGERGITEWV